MEVQLIQLRTIVSGWFGQNPEKSMPKSYYRKTECNSTQTMKMLIKISYCDDIVFDHDATRFLAAQPMANIDTKYY